MQFKELKERMIEPEPGYGPVPFFALNSDLKEEELVWALEELSRAGVSGIFLHPRTGLEIEYLSEEFFEKIGVIIRNCARLGLKAWLYDEYNWPSGVAGGKLLGKHPEYRQKFLDYLMLRRAPAGKVLELPGEVVAVFEVEERVECLGRIWRGNQVEVLRVNHPVLIFYQGESRERMFVNSCASWVKEELGYLDIMNPEAVKVFIEMTHEQYAKRFGLHFGKTIPGIFTDEPQQYNGFPWSEQFRGRFLEEYGYDPVEKLYLLVLDREDFIKFRIQFYSLAERMMRDAFYVPLSRWCEEHNLILTGHLGMEERITQMALNHGGIFYHLSAMQMPGIDALNVGDGLNGGLSNMEAPNFAVKAVSSIAHLWGKSRVLCETGGGAGWQMSLGRFKLMTDWLFGLGINFINPHHCLLSIKGLRKRDFPPSHFWQEPWWEYYPEFSRYLARVSWLLSQGEHQPEIGVLVPSIEIKVRTRGRGFQEETLKELSQQIEDLCKNLIQAQRDFELVFEEAIIEGRLQLEKGKIVAGKEIFEVLIIPAVKVLAKETLDFLLKFAQTGGKLIFLGSLPEFDQNGNEAQEWQASLLAFSDQLKIFSPPLPVLELVLETLARLNSGRLFLSSAGLLKLKLVLHQRKIGEQEIYFLGNLESLRFRVKARLKTEKKGIELFLPFSGEIKKIPFSRIGDSLVFSLELNPMESVVFIASDEIDPSWVRETELVLTDLDNEKIAGYSLSREVKIFTGKQELIVKSQSDLPPVISISGPFSFSALSDNFYRLGPFKVITAPQKILPRSNLSKEFFFTRRTRWLIYLLKGLLRVLNFFLRPESRYRGLVYEEFADLDEEVKMFSWISGIPLEQRGLYEMLGLIFRFIEYLPLRTLFRVYPPSGAYYEARTEFILKTIPRKLELVWEDLGERVEIQLNGRTLEQRPERIKVWDRANVGVEISSYLKPGKNHLIFRSRMPDFPSLFPSLHTLEPIVLKGAFEVNDNGVLTQQDKLKPAGDLKKLGYPHYSGKVRYQTEVEITKEYLGCYLLLSCGEVQDQAEVFVNGKSAGRRFAPPYEFAIGHLVQEGKNQFEFIISNTSANLLGVPESWGLLGPIMIIPFYKFEKSRS